MYQVLKRDGKVIDFNLAKITDAIKMAFEAQEKQYHPSIIDFLSLKVTADFESKIKEGLIAVEDIQDSVDIMSVADAMNMKEKTGCDGLMIARGAMGNPWLFAEIAAALEGREFVPPTLEERMNTAIAQMERMIEEKGERVGFAESKKQLAWYIHGVVGAAEARGRLMIATSPAEAADILRGLSR